MRFGGFQKCVFLFFEFLSLLTLLFNTGFNNNGFNTNNKTAPLWETKGERERERERESETKKRKKRKKATTSIHSIRSIPSLLLLQKEFGQNWKKSRHYFSSNEEETTFWWWWWWCDGMN